MLQSLIIVFACAVAVMLPAAFVPAILHLALSCQNARRLMWRVYLGALGASEAGFLALLVVYGGPEKAAAGFVFWQFFGTLVVVFGFTDS